MEHCEYKTAFTFLCNNYAGARGAVQHLVEKEISKGVKNLLDDKEGSLLKKGNLENIKNGQLIWLMLQSTLPSCMQH